MNGRTGEQGAATVSGLTESNGRPTQVDPLQLVTTPSGGLPNDAVPPPRRAAGDSPPSITTRRKQRHSAPRLWMIRCA